MKHRVSTKHIMTACGMTGTTYDMVLKDGRGKYEVRFVIEVTHNNMFFDTAQLLSLSRECKSNIWHRQVSTYLYQTQCSINRLGLISLNRKILNNEKSQLEFQSE